MTREFRSLGEFAAHLLELQIGEAVALNKGLEVVAAHIEATAKEEIGHYQEAIGPFPEWPELADATKADRLRHGFTENDPLLRTGELRASVGHEVEGLEAVVGSTSDVMVYQELGTHHIPPRPVLGPAAIQNEGRIKRILGAAAVSGLIGTERIHEALGYDFETTE